MTTYAKWIARVAAAVAFAALLAFNANLMETTDAVTAEQTAEAVYCAEADQICYRVSTTAEYGTNAYYKFGERIFPEAD
jgi:hypothetical protein